jgi:hypothetical protein
MPKSRHWSYSKAYPGAGSYYQKAAEKAVNNQTKKGHYFDMRKIKNRSIPLSMQTQLAEDILLE